MNHAKAARRNQHIQLWYEAGENHYEIAEYFNIVPQYIRVLAKKFGWKTPVSIAPRLQTTRKHFTRELSLRDKFIIEQFKNGVTLEEIGRSLGITRERVRQILARFNLSRLDGGATIRSFKDVQKRIETFKDKEADKEQAHFNKWGCSIGFVRSISDLPRSNSNHPVRLYRRQQQSAKNRGIDWDMSFAEWWKIWQDSGKWEVRGRGKGYCMARMGDSGPYKADNVEIITVSQNFKDSYITKSWESRFPALARDSKTKVRFYWLKRTGTWQVAFRKKYIGKIKVSL